MYGQFCICDEIRFVDVRTIAAEKKIQFAMGANENNNIHKKVFGGKLWKLSVNSQVQKVINLLSHQISVI